MEPVSYVTSQRIAAVLEDTLSKIKLLSSITPDVLAHRDELSEFVGEEISHVIEGQKELEERYEQLISERAELKKLSNKTKFRENQLELQEVTKKLRESTKNLCRNLKENPNVTGNLLKIQRERDAVADLIAQTIDEIREKRTFKIMIKHVEESRAEHERLANLISQESKTADEVAKIKDTIKQQTSRHERLEREKTTTISELKEQLKEIRANLDFSSDYSRRESRAKIAALVRANRTQEAELLEKIEELKQIKEMEEHVHADTAKFLERKQQSLLAQSEEWKEKYEADIEDFDLKMEELRTERNEHMERLAVLQKRWDEHVATEQAALDEKNRQNELKKQAELDLVNQTKSAIVIQKLCRQHLNARRAAKGAKAAKGKKGGKGKKK